jgi:small subunit ribosomal protein S9
VSDEPKQPENDETASPNDAPEAQAGEQSASEDAPPVESKKEPSGKKPSKEGQKDEKKEAVPGAELDPIAIEEPEVEMDAEERARAEAEAEERAEREAQIEARNKPIEVKPTELSADARFMATGKRKSSVARVILSQGGGEFKVNERPLEEYFPRPYLRTVAMQALAQTGYEGNVDVRVRVHGGGISGQASAVRHGIARALCEIDPALRQELKRRGMLSRDARVKERRKAGLKKARKRPQFSKR